MYRLSFSQIKRKSAMKGSETMKHRPMTRDERRHEEPQDVRDLRREVCKEIQTMDERELSNLLWKLRQRKR